MQPPVEFDQIDHERAPAAPCACCLQVCVPPVGTGFPAHVPPSPVNTMELEPEELAVDVDEPDREPEALPLVEDARELEPVGEVLEPPAPVLPDEAPDP